VQTSSEKRAGSGARGALIAAGLSAPLVVLLDQLSKWIIWNTYGPAGDRIESEYLGGLVRLHLVRNTGSAFGMFQGQSSFLTIAALVAIVVLGAFFFRSARQDRLVALSLGLLIGGAIGNLIDRIRLGYVIDWVRLPITLSFNIADAAVMAGMVLIFGAILLRDFQDGERRARPGAGRGGVDEMTSVNED
jgi:signal peptidase II